MDLFFEIAGNQIDGARDYQEDAFLTNYIDDEDGASKASSLVIMADGMGGHAAGNIASNLVATTFSRTFTGRFGQDDTSALLREALLKANEALSASIKETPALDGMGCTMVTAAFTKGKVHWVSVGDSHLYLIRDQKLHKKNEDHSYGGYLDRMKAQGMDVEAEAGLSRNMLMSAMTGDDIAEIDCPDNGFQLMPGDWLIVASDGLDTLSAATIVQFSSWSQSAKECVDALLKAVEDAAKPRQDNTTVVVVDVLEREAAAPPADVPAAEEAGYEHEEVEESGGGKGPMLAIVAVVVLAILGGGGWFMFGRGDDTPAPVTATAPAPEVASTEPEPQAAQPETPQPETAAPESAAPEAATTEPETAAPETVAQPVPAVPVAPEVAQEFRDKLASGGEAPVMVRLPGGTFQMGSGGLSVDADERPAHEVTIAPFAMSKYEVTFEEYELFVKATGRKSPNNLYLDRDVHPVIFVSWDDAYAYTQWLSEQTGESYRLPSEAEWEYAARAGTDTTYWWGFDAGENNAHCFDCRTGLNPRQPTRVGRFNANAYGLHDTAGNVAEWVHDCYHSSYQGAPSDGAVWEGGDCSARVTRGGAFTGTAKSIRPASRSKFKSRNVYDSVGIRLARDL